MSEDQQPLNRWGDPISEERQNVLRGYLDRWENEQDHGERKGPFDSGPDRTRVPLTGADVFWLTERVRDKDMGTLSNLLEEADLREAHLEQAFLSAAHLEGAFLSAAHLEGAFLSAAHLEGASLFEAHLEGADLSAAHLGGAGLDRATLDASTRLDQIVLDDHTRLGYVRWGDAYLGGIDWSRVRQIGEDTATRTRVQSNGKRKRRSERIEDFENAILVRQRQLLVESP